VALRVVLVPKGIVWSVPALTVGNGLTVTVTSELTELNPSSTTTVYMVVTVGLTDGFADVDVKVPGDEVQL
jgi:hypothetical protein